MSDATEDVTPPPPLPEPPPAEPPAPERRRIGGALLVAAVAIIIVIVVVVASPFWAPPIMRILPWGGTSETPRSAALPATDPALAALKAQTSQNAAAVQQLGQQVAALQAKPPPDLSTVQQQLGALGQTTSELSQKVAALDKAMREHPAEDPKNTALAVVLLQIRDAVDTGRPFDAEYQALVALAKGHPDIAAAAAPLAEPAQSGVASRAALIERLRQLAPQIATAKPPPKATWKSQMVARLRSLVTIRRIDEGEGQSPAEAAVGKAQRDIAAGDLAGAVAALDGLTGANQTAAEPWLKMAKQRLAVENALRQVAAALTASLGNAAPTPPGKGG
jgi:hypothetical protein